MKKTSLFAFLAAAMITLSSCAGTYHLEHSATLNKAEIANYRTFSIAPFEEAARMSKKGKAQLSEDEYNHLANGLRNEMIARGYSEDPASDLKVNFSLFVERNADITTNLYPDYYYGRFGMYHPYAFRRPYTGYTSTRIYKEGIWVINIVAAQNKMLLYSAAVSAEMSPKTLTLKSPDEIAKASAVLFKKFPVKPAKK
ncbi:MAG: hypothetical protein H6Q17_88 [Bacteroidetes bacterium]|nr:hypothetical protein [Bacteroidota bacterium]